MGLAQILAVLTAWLENDPDVQALWLGGSIGRGMADDRSDLDLYVAVSGERFVDFYQQVPRRVQALVPLEHVVEFTFRRESPTERVWFLYPAETSIHQRIDFHVHTVESARGADPDHRRELVGQEWQVLKDPQQLLAVLPPVALPEPDAYHAHLQERVDYLAMVFALLAGYIARGQFWPVVSHLGALQERVLYLAAVVRDPGSVGDGYPRRLARAVDPQLVARLEAVRFGDSPGSQATAALELLAVFAAAARTTHVRYPEAFVHRVREVYKELCCE